MALKRFLCLTTVVVFLFNSIGYFAVMLIRLQQVKDEAEAQIKQQLPLNLLTVIAEPTSNETICNKAREGEFSLNGEMYDVAKTETNDDTLYCYCLNDRAETKINQSLNQNDQVIDQSKQVQLQNTKTVVKSNVETNYFSKDKLIFNVSAFACPTFTIENHFVLLNGFQQIHTPPPRLS